MTLRQFVFGSRGQWIAAAGGHMIVFPLWIRIRNRAVYAINHFLGLE